VDMLVVLLVVMRHIEVTGGEESYGGLLFSGLKV